MIRKQRTSNEPRKHDVERQESREDFLNELDGEPEHDEDYGSEDDHRRYESTYVTVDWQVNHLQRKLHFAILGCRTDEDLEKEPWYLNSESCI